MCAVEGALAPLHELLYKCISGFFDYKFVLPVDCRIETSSQVEDNRSLLLLTAS